MSLTDIPLGESRVIELDKSLLIKALSSPQGGINKCAALSREIANRTKQEMFVDSYLAIDSSSSLQFHPPIPVLGGGTVDTCFPNPFPPEDEYYSSQRFFLFPFLRLHSHPIPEETVPANSSFSVFCSRRDLNFALLGYTEGENGGIKFKFEYSPIHAIVTPRHGDVFLYGSFDENVESETFQMPLMENYVLRILLQCWRPIVGYRNMAPEDLFKEDFRTRVRNAYSQAGQILQNDFGLKSLYFQGSIGNISSSEFPSAKCFDDFTTDLLTEEDLDLIATTFAQSVKITRIE